MSTHSGKVLPSREIRKQKVVWHSKSRLGCLRCKHRHIKCDQAIPACLQCRQRNFECPGYQKPVKWSTKYQVNNRQTADGNGSAWFVKAAEQASAALFETPLSEASNPMPAPDKISLASAGHLPFEPDQPPDDSWTPLENGTHSAFPIQLPRPDSGGSPVPEANLTPGSGRQLDDPTSPLSGLFEHLGPHDSEAFYGMTLSSESALVAHCDSAPRLVGTYLRNEDAMLLQYYLTTVCGISSCFDSDKNPLRTDVVSLMFDSPLLYHSILSMTAAHMSSQRMDIVSKAIEHQSEALQNLRDAISRMGGEQLMFDGPSPPNIPSLGSKTEFLDKVLLASIILGITSAWHTPTSFGNSHLSGARALFRLWSLRKLDESDCGIQSLFDSAHCSFVLGAMSYWEAMTAFVADDGPGGLDYLIPFTDRGLSEVFPNPWTGCSTQLFILVAMTGRLVRRKRLAKQTIAAIRSSATRMMILSELEDEARALESRLCNHSTSSETKQNTEDENCPISHLQVVAKVYRLAALLELHRAFPNLVSSRMLSSPQQGNALGQEPTFFHRGFILDCGIAILTLLASIPLNSGTKTSQIFPILVAAAVLKPNSLSPKSLQEQSLDYELKDTLWSSAATDRWRNFVCTRMTHLCRYIGLPLLSNIVQVIQEVWLRLDNEVPANCGTEQTAHITPHHWVDVMSELHLETILG